MMSDAIGLTRRTVMAGAAVGVAAGPLFGNKGTKMLRVAQIGMQGHCGYVLNGIPKVDDCELVAVARSSPNERIERLKELGRWTEDMRVMGLPKVAHRKAAVGKKGKTKEQKPETEGGTAESEEKEKEKESK